jgi:hypothetical protein
MHKKDANCFFFAAEFKGPRAHPWVQKSKGPKVQGSKGPRVQKLKGPRAHGSKNSRVQGQLLGFGKQTFARAASGHATTRDRIKRGANNGRLLLVELTGRPHATAWMAPLAAMSIITHHHDTAAARVGFEPVAPISTVAPCAADLPLAHLPPMQPGATTANIWTTPAFFRLSRPEWAGWGPLELASPS